MAATRSGSVPLRVAAKQGWFMETSIFLAILLAVVLALIYQIRREMRKDAAPTPEIPTLTNVERPAEVAPPSPSPDPGKPQVEEAAPVLMPVQPPPVQTLPAPTSLAQTPVVAPVVEIGEQPKAKKARAVAAPAGELPPSAVQLVRGMLKKRDSLAAAFLLREIFDRPVSRRRRHR